MALFDATMTRRFFYAPSFEGYGGFAGLYDYGPLGCSLQKEIIAEWRRHFVTDDGASEIDCVVLTPAIVMRSSGHEEKFIEGDTKVMFQTTMGSGSRAYLRPETAQGIFNAFPRLLDHNRGRLPMAVAQIGKAFRNEISPHGGLLRTREFLMAEIEYFHDSTDNTHPRYESVADLVVNGTSIRSMGVSEIFGYYLGRVYMFLVNCGVKSDKIRFRQHEKDEMAHYATECWDVEIFTSRGWVECVGCANRSDYDLRAHNIKAPKHTHVIEPSFGIGRIMLAILEHNYDGRVMCLPARIAPVKCSVMPISNKPVFTPFVNRIRDDLSAHRCTHEADSSSQSIGRRYARADECGTAYVAVVDFQTLVDDTVTLRWIEAPRAQVRLKIDDVAFRVWQLCSSMTTW